MNMAVIQLRSWLSSNQVGNQRKEWRERCAFRPQDPLNAIETRMKNRRDNCFRLLKERHTTSIRLFKDTLSPLRFH